MKCKDPCVGSCGFNAECHVYNHIPQCTCPQGHIGNPFVSCHIQQAQRKNYSYLYNIVNDDNMYLIDDFIYNSKLRNYVNCTLFNFNTLRHKFNFKLRYILNIINKYTIIKEQNSASSPV